MTRQQTIQLALNQGWSVCCVVIIGCEVGGTWGRQRSSQLKDFQRRNCTCSTFRPSPSLRRKTSSKSMVLCGIKAMLIPNFYTSDLLLSIFCRNKFSRAKTFNPIFIMMFARWNCLPVNSISQQQPPSPAESDGRILGKHPLSNTYIFGGRSATVVFTKNRPRAMTLTNANDNLLLARLLAL